MNAHLVHINVIQMQIVLIPLKDILVDVKADGLMSVLIHKMHLEDNVEKVFIEISILSEKEFFLKVINVPVLIVHQKLNVVKQLQDLSVNVDLVLLIFLVNMVDHLDVYAELLLMNAKKISMIVHPMHLALIPLKLLPVVVMMDSEMIVQTQVVLVVFVIKLIISPKRLNVM